MGLETLQHLDRLVEAVQRNCDISDARHARDMSMCTYLLEMREYFRWEHEIPLDQPPPRHELGNWLTRREAHWNSVEADAFAQLPIDGVHYEPFDVAAINRRINPYGLVYGAGVGRFGKPHFFLGELARHEQREGFDVLVTSCEYARDITAIPAAFQNDAIFLRRDALRRWLWEKVELWNVKKGAGPLRAALDCYGYRNDPRESLDRMTEAAAETLLLHEVGEGRAERLLGASWNAMISSLTHRRAEILARAVRDNLADCLSTLPGLIERRAECALHFHFANFEGLRRAIFPRLAEGYRTWNECRDLRPLIDAARNGTTHWSDVASRLIDIHRRDPGGADAAIEALLADNRAGLIL